MLIQSSYRSRFSKEHADPYHDVRQLTLGEIALVSLIRGKRVLYLTCLDCPLVQK